MPFSFIWENYSASSLPLSITIYFWNTFDAQKLLNIISNVNWIPLTPNLKSYLSFTEPWKYFVISSNLCYTFIKISITNHFKEKIIINAFWFESADCFIIRNFHWSLNLMRYYFLNSPIVAVLINHWSVEMICVY